MYIKSTLAVLFSSIVINGLAQIGTHVIILSPATHDFHKTPEKAIKKRVESFKKGLNLTEAEQYLQSPEFSKREENIQTMQKSEVAYLKVLDEVKIVSYLTEQHLTYHLLEKLETAVIEVKDLTSTGTDSDLQRIAKEGKAEFVLNISQFDLAYVEGKNIADIHVQLFDANSEKVILDQTYEGNSANQGFEYACEDGSVDCCINNSISKIVAQVSKLIISNDPATIKQKQLEAEQDKILKAVLSEKTNWNVLKKIIPSSDKSIEQKNAYQVLFSTDSTKFVAFFAEMVPASEGKTFRDKHEGDKNVNIISNDEMSFFSGSLPNTYAYIVYGVLYKGKWYYKKSEITYFDAASLDAGKAVYFGNLRKWGFFIENTATPDNTFWEGKETSGYALQTKVIFSKVPQSEPYAGLYWVVADQKSEDEKK